jgi:hypothetical protein
MQSPIRHLMMTNLPNSVFNIAPERQAQFGTSLDDFDLIYVSQRRWKFCCFPERTPCEIWVSRGAVELMWCASLAHFLFYSRMIKGRKFDQPTVIDPQSDSVVHDALRLLAWAINCQLKREEADDWPQGLPCPLQSPALESNENVADELCLVSCAYFLHHELAHIRLGHSSGVNNALSLSQEKDADIAAAEWVLDGISVDSPMFVKRMLGIVQGFLLTTAMGLYGGSLGGNTHPFSYDRLSSLLNRFLGNTPHVTKGIAFAILDLHFQNSGRTLKKAVFPGPEEALEALCDQLAEEAHAKKNEVLA